MKLIEIKKIAKQTNYRIKRSECELTLFRDVGNNGVILNKILIDLSKKSLLFINNMFCDEKDLQMIKATVEFAETPPEDREEDTKDKLLNEINRILNNVKDFDNKGLMEVLNSIEKLEDDLEIFAKDLKNVLVEVEE